MKALAEPTLDTSKVRSGNVRWHVAHEGNASRRSGDEVKFNS